jgi:hypothetical protein
MRWNLVVCVALARVAWGAQYVVSTSGSDTNDGSAAHPWKTLQHAADQVVAGDTVSVLAGTYQGFSLGWNNPQNGTSTAPITFSAQACGRTWWATRCSATRRAACTSRRAARASSPMR